MYRRGTMPHARAIIRRAAVIAQNEILVFGDRGLRHRALIAILFRHIIFHQRLSIHDYGAVIHFHPIAGDRDDALDVALGGIMREPEHHRVAAIDLSKMKSVNKLVDEMRS